jgi:hypothetical protein
VPFIPCPGVAEVSILTNTPDGDVAQNNIHVYKGAGTAWSLADLTALVNAIDTWAPVGAGASQAYTQLLASVCTVVQIKARDLTVLAGLEYTKTVTHAGLDTNTPLPQGLTKCFTLRTGLAGRSYRGRVYVPMMTTVQQDTVDRNNMLASYAANHVASWTSLLAAVVTAGASWQWGVLSRYSGMAGGHPIPRVNGVITPITAVGYSHVAFDFQRRRAPFHSRHH